MDAGTIALIIIGLVALVLTAAKFLDVRAR